MTGKRSFGEVIPLPQAGHDRVDDLRAVVPVRDENAVSPLDESAWANVLPFVRPGANDNARDAPEVVLPTDLARLPAKTSTDRVWLLALVALSLTIHGGLAVLLWHDPPPLASIGLEVISVELVLGATTPAGAAPAPGENETQSMPAPDSQVTEADKAEAKATEQQQDVQVAEKETAPEVKAEPPAAEPPKEYEPATAAEVTPAEHQPAVAMVETPNPETTTAIPPETTAPAQEFSMLPQPLEKPIVKKPEAKKAAPPKPVKDAKPAPERRRIAAPTRDKASQEAKASTPSSQANSVGVGRSSNDTNYRGLVAAHLARYKQFPGDARSRGIGGTASVIFTVSGGGGVSSVRLAGGSGVASIDQEVQAMVRRASPFPPPPGGRAQSFTVPVSFRLN